MSDDYAKDFWTALYLSITGLPLVMWVWPNVVPFKFFEFWQIRGTPYEWIYAAWPMFAWAFATTAFNVLRGRNDPESNLHAEDILSAGLYVSLKAGILEELTFRWLFFLLNIIIVQIANFVLLGFIGLNIVAWLYLHIFGPVWNFLSLGALAPYLFHPAGWAVGSGLLAANSFFRDGHKYQGLFGWANSWFLGMYLFWIMFNYGLLAAILVHFLYDFLIFTIVYADAAVERAQER